MFCEICMSALNPPKSFDSGEITHHASFQSLSDAARQGCPICSKLLGLLPERNYCIIPDEPAQCTQYRHNEDRSFPFATLRIAYSFNWLVTRLPEYEPFKFNAVHYYLISVTADELRKESCLRGGAEAWDTCPDQQSTTRLFGVDTGSEQSWQLIEHWTKSCNRRHSMCSSVTDAQWFPTRLIYVGDENKNPRLYVPDFVSWNSEDRYTTLSHRWGSDSRKVAKLVTDNLNTLQQQICTDELPQTFQDAINITKRLGIKFIWIDSLCIIQDDNKDWEREAAKMSMVYTNTYLNISATSAHNGDQGCYRVRDPMKVAGFLVRRAYRKPAKKSWFPSFHHRPDRKSPFHTEPDGTSWVKVVDQHFWRRNVDNAPLNKRGWVLQERLLSPRVLHFSADQVLWECRQKYACETLPRSLPRMLQRGGFFDNPYLRDFVPRKPGVPSVVFGKHRMSQQWLKVVEAYSKADLTYQTDKLIALSGIAKEVQYVLQSTYAAGLWRSNLPYSLLWIVNHDTYRSAEYLAPSWSWVSVIGSVYFPLELKLEPPDPEEECATLLDLDIELVTPSNPFGQVKNGWIRLKGRLGVASWKWAESRSSAVRKIHHSVAINVPSTQGYTGTKTPKQFHLVPGRSFPHDSTLFVAIDLDDVVSIACQAYFLPLYKDQVARGYSVYGLLLQLLPTGQFTRIGVLKFRDKRAEEIISCLEEREVTII